MITNKYYFLLSVMKNKLFYTILFFILIIYLLSIDTYLYLIDPVHLFFVLSGCDFSEQILLKISSLFWTLMFYFSLNYLKFKDFIFNYKKYIFHFFILFIFLWIFHFVELFFIITLFPGWAVFASFSNKYLLLQVTEWPSSIIIIFISTFIWNSMFYIIIASCKQCRNNYSLHKEDKVKVLVKGISCIVFFILTMLLFLSACAIILIIKYVSQYKILEVSYSKTRVIGILYLLQK